MPCRSRHRLTSATRAADPSISRPEAPRTVRRIAPASGEERDLVLALLGEDVSVTKRVTETGRVSVRRVTRVESAPIAEALASERIEITRQPIGRDVEVMPSIREEGDTLVIPVVEERLVIERRLFLKEEVHVRRRRTFVVHRENVLLRHHDVVITRTPTGKPSDAPKADD